MKVSQKVPGRNANSLHILVLLPSGGAEHPPLYALGGSPLWGPPEDIKKQNSDV